VFISTATIALVAYLGSWALIVSSFMVDQHPFLFEALTWVDNNSFPFQQHLKVACDLLPPSIRGCFLSFKQFIRQQMVWLQDSIQEHLHHHTLSKMFVDKIYIAHHAWILSCFGPRVSVWLTTRPLFLSFWLDSSIFFIVVRIWYGLPHPSIVNIPWCVCTHPINPMGIHFLCCVHANKLTWTHDVIHYTFVAIMKDVGFHVGQEQLHALPSNTFNFSCQWIDIVLTKDDIRTLVDLSLPTQHVNKFISLILRHPRICYFWCGSSQKRSYCDQSILPLSSEGIWMST